MRLEPCFVLRRLYIDNYRSLVNFELKFGQVNLLMGANGSGKSSVFAALAGLRRFVHAGESVRDCFPVSSCTRWQTRRVQTLEIDVAAAEGAFHYRVELEHAGSESIVKAERLECDGRPHLVRTEAQLELWDETGDAPSDRGLGFSARRRRPDARRAIHRGSRRGADARRADRPGMVPWRPVKCGRASG